MGERIRQRGFARIVILQSDRDQGLSQTPGSSRDYQIVYDKQIAKIRTRITCVQLAYDSPAEFFYRVLCRGKLCKLQPPGCRRHARMPCRLVDPLPVPVPCTVPISLPILPLPVAYRSLSACRPCRQLLGPWSALSRPGIHASGDGRECVVFFRSRLTL